MREQSSNAGPNPDEAFRSTHDIRGLVACFTSTRVGVSQLLGYLRDGDTIDDFLNDFPTVRRDEAQRSAPSNGSTTSTSERRSGTVPTSLAGRKQGHRGRRVHGVGRPG